tara:strand:+ start:866 stop:1063 length:198 start_codon:yes stop_codon:yes gene_type:complete
MSKTLMDLQLKAIIMSWELLESECRRLGIPLLERQSGGISDLHRSAERVLDKHYDKILNQLINNK